MGSWSNDNTSNDQVQEDAATAFVKNPGRAPECEGYSCGLLEYGGVAG